MGLKKWAGLWGFAEASFFFFVPDILLTYVALSKTKTIVVLLSVYALVGALLGGLLMYLFGIAWNTEMNTLLTWIPAIDATLVTLVQEELQEAGVLAILLGPTEGIPYKIYAVNAANAGISLPFFLLITIPARVVRFLLAGLVTWWISQKLLRSVTLPLKIALWGSFWVIFYISYFISMG